MKLTFFICCASLLEAIILQLMILAQKLSQWQQKTMMCRYLCAKKSSKIQNEQMIPIISFHEHMILNNIFFCWFQAYLFDGYWEDIGTIKSFFEANLALTDQVHFQLTSFPEIIFLCRIIMSSIIFPVSELLFLRSCEAYLHIS